MTFINQYKCSVMYMGATRYMHTNIRYVTKTMICTCIGPHSKNIKLGVHYESWNLDRGNLVYRRTWSFSKWKQAGLTTSYGTSYSKWFNGNIDFILVWRLGILVTGSGFCTLGKSINNILSSQLCKILSRFKIISFRAFRAIILVQQIAAALGGGLFMCTLYNIIINYYSII